MGGISFVEMFFQGKQKLIFFIICCEVKFRQKMAMLTKLLY